MIVKLDHFPNFRDENHQILDETEKILDENRDESTTQFCPNPNFPKSQNWAAVLCPAVP